VTAITIPYVLMTDDVPVLPGFLATITIDVQEILDEWRDQEADDIEDDELELFLMNWVRSDFCERVSANVDAAVLAAAVKQAREALQIRDTEQALTHGA
jgi:uncharacterized protein YfdQ (DUF2303 family)